MQNKLTLLSIIGIAAAFSIVVAMLILQAKTQSLQGALSEVQHIQQQPNPEDFLKQSAREMVDPTEENMKIAKEQAQNPDEASLFRNQDDCMARGETSDCYETFYRTLVAKEGVGKAFEDLKARYLTSGFVQAQCHPLAHVIGQAATAVYPTPAIAYKHGDSFCWSGYYHGVLEGVSAKLGKEKLVAGLNELCDGIEGQESYSFDYYNCVHGLGHGLMAMTNDELFESLSLCDNLAGTWEKESCYGGVFMENVIVDNRNHFTQYLKPEEPLYPCTAVAKPYKQACFLMQTSYMLKVSGGDFLQAFELCSTVEDDFRPTCYQSVGRDASGRNSSNVTATHATCSLGKNDEQILNCIIGAVKDFIAYYHSDIQAKQLCSSFAEHYQGICNTTLEKYYTTF